MDLEVNTSKLAELLFKNSSCGYSIRINAFEGWLKKNKYMYQDIAEILNIPEKQFKEKISKKRKLDKRRISCLINLMGDADAFHVLYFESFQKRKDIYKELFGKELCKTHFQEVNNYGKK